MSISMVGTNPGEVWCTRHLYFDFVVIPRSTLATFWRKWRGGRTWTLFSLFRSWISCIFTILMDKSARKMHCAVYVSLDYRPILHLDSPRASRL